MFAENMILSLTVNDPINKSFYITKTANLQKSLELYNNPLALTSPFIVYRFWFLIFFEIQANNVVFPAPFPLNK